MDQLHFNLRLSLLRFGLIVGLFIILSMVFSQYLAGLGMGLAMMAVLLVLYVFHERNPIQSIAQLDAQLWVLENKQKQKLHRQLIAISAFGPCVFLTFLDIEQQQSNKICITKDQLDRADWQKLQSLVNFF